MPQHAQGSFEVTSWDEIPVPNLGDEVKVTRATIGQRLSGEIEADTVTDTVMTYREDGTADYVGFQRIVGKLDGRTGSFVLQTVGTFDGKEAVATTTVVPGSGTGQLAGLRGTGTSVAPIGPKGTLTLDFEIA